MAEIAVSVKNLYKIFGTFHAVDDISFNVPSGCIFGFLGPNGAGKSTTIKMLCGLLKPSSGSGRVGKYDIMKDSEEIKKNIGYMSQKFSLYDDLSVIENLQFFGTMYNLRGAVLEERVETALKLAELSDSRHILTQILPGGIKQRLALGCAILHKPQFLFLDEPTSGVDPMSRRNFWSIIHDFARIGITVFVTTHYMEEAEYCDYLVLIYRGKIVVEGTPAELKSSKLQTNIYRLNCTAPSLLYEKLEASQKFSEVNLFGDAVHIVSPDDIAGVQKAISDIADYEKIEIVNLQKILPSLEDIFVLAIAEANKR